MGHAELPMTLSVDVAQQQAILTVNTAKQQMLIFPMKMLMQQDVAIQRAKIAVFKKEWNAAKTLNQNMDLFSRVEVLAIKRSTTIHVIVQKVLHVQQQITIVIKTPTAFRAAVKTQNLISQTQRQ